MCNQRALGTDRHEPFVAASEVEQAVWFRFVIAIIVVSVSSSVGKWVFLTVRIAISTACRISQNVGSKRVVFILVANLPGSGVIDGMLAAE